MEKQIRHIRMHLHKKIIWQIIVSAAIRGIAIIVFNMLAVRGTIHPIRELADVARVIRAGELSREAHSDRQNEIRELAKALNNMTRQLSQPLENLSKKNVEPERPDKLRDKFLANTSHELRTPLKGIADSMPDGAVGPVTEAPQHNLSLIASGGCRLTNLVNDILYFSKLRHHEIQLQLSPPDVRSVTDLVLMLSQALAGDKEIRLVWQYSP